MISTIRVLVMTGQRDSYKDLFTKKTFTRESGHPGLVYPGIRKSGTFVIGFVPDPRITDCPRENVDIKIEQ